MTYMTVQLVVMSGLALIQMCCQMCVYNFLHNSRSTDYHDSMNNELFKNWISEELLPMLKEPSLIIIDNTS